MISTKGMRRVMGILLLFCSLVGTAGWGGYWFTFRAQQAEWRLFAVGLLLSAVLGWWPWISLVTGLALALATWVAGAEPASRLQQAEEIMGFWILGLGWGTLARWQFQTLPAPRNRHRPAQAPRAMDPAADSSSAPRTADPTAFRSRRLMEGAGEELNWPEDPIDPKPSAPPLDSGRTPKSAANDSSLSIPLPSLEGPPASVLLPPPPPPKPLPRPSAAPMLAEYGGESVYLGSLPGATGASLVPESTQPEAEPGDAVVPASPSTGAIVSRFSIPEEPSVVPVADFPTMELPVNSLLRPQSPRGSESSSSVAGPASSVGSASGAGDSGGDGEGMRRSSLFKRPETTPGASWEHLLEWYNQFSYAPWTAPELERVYHRPGIQVGWETMALRDVAAVWKIWRQGCIPLSLAPDRIALKAFEGFLRCEVLGVLRQQGFPDLHVLSRADGTDGWLAVYSEIRGRMRGGEATIHRVDSGPDLEDAGTGLVGRPDRLAEIRGESDVIALVTPFSVNEGLSWTTVYALAQYRLAHAMGQLLSGTPVVVNLPLPIWDERKQSRLATVDDLVSEQRRLDVALERFRRVLTGQAAPRAQTHASTCSGCGWRHFCPSYQGARPRLDLASPPPQISAALR